MTDKYADQRFDRACPTCGQEFLRERVDALTETLKALRPHVAVKDVPVIDAALAGAPVALKVTNVAGEYKDPEGLVECFRERLAEFGLVLTDDPDFDGEPDFGLILSNRPLTDEEVNAHRMFADRDDEDDRCPLHGQSCPDGQENCESYKMGFALVSADCSTDGDPGPLAAQVDPRIIIGEKEKFVELYLDHKYPVAVRLGNIAPDSLAMRDAEAAWAKIQGLKAARPDQAELVAMYINEGQHQDGVTYWDEFATLEEVIEDFDLVAKFEAESSEEPHTCTACGIGPSMVCANPNCKCKCHTAVNEAAAEVSQ